MSRLLYMRNSTPRTDAISVYAFFRASLKAIRHDTREIYFTEPSIRLDQESRNSLQILGNEPHQDPSESSDSRSAQAPYGASGIGNALRDDAQWR